MSDYSRSIDFTAKDALTTGDPNKIVKGSDMDSELDAIGTASVTKSNKYPPVASGNVAALSAAGDLVDSLVTSTELDILDGATVTTAELNLLDGVTATTAEINTLDGITASVVELNLMDGVTATTAEINVVDGITATASEINTLDGITSTVSELNILDGVTSTTAELNILDGVTSTATELNALDGITATVTELNYTDGVTSAIQTQLGTKLVASSNLSDVASAATSRTNLGLGDLAVLDTVDTAQIDANAITPVKLGAVTVNQDTDYCINWGNRSSVAVGTTNQKVIKFVVPADGTYSVYLGIGNFSGFTTTAYGRIYKNGVAYGTNRSNTSSYPDVNYYWEDLAFVAGDTVEFWGDTAHSSGGVSAYIYLCGLGSPSYVCQYV